METDVTTITTSSLILTLCFGVLLLALPRRYALVPLLISGCYMTLGQILMLGPLHFSIFRILILFGWVRIFIRKELVSLKLNSIDKVLIVWALVSSALYILLRGGTSPAFISRLGTLYDVIGIYFLIRALVWDFDDIVHAVKMLGIIIIPLAILFTVEWTTGRNFFAVYGGVPEFTAIRDGRLRCQGPFRHPILAGTFGATVMPLFVGLWVYKSRWRRLATSAIVAATVIVITSSSSGPLLAYLAGLVGLTFWALRTRMRLVRWGIVVSLLALAAVMKAPVWFVIDRLSSILRMGSGWYRSALIDAAIRHFNEWWLMGTRYTAHWMPTGISIDPDSADIVNQFISEGVNGGFISLCLFIWLLVKCFKAVGDTVRDETAFARPEQFMIWSIGSVLLAHVASFFSVSYFDQIIIFWYLTVAMSATLFELNAYNWTVLVNEETDSLVEVESPGV